MISINKIIFGVILGSSFLIFVALKLFSPSEPVQASSLKGDLLIADIVSPSSPNPCTISTNYPESIFSWCGLIEASAAKYSLDPNLIAAVILQESGGNADAYSHSGAVGLMQIMPRDGIAEKFICMNGPCFANRPSMDELFDPEFNIDYGSKMLKNLFEKYGNWREALYKYGPMDIGYRYADIVLNIYNNY